MRARFRTQRIAAPDLMRIEVLSFIRRRSTRAGLERIDAVAALRDLLDLPILVYPTAPLLDRVWDLRDNLTPYDACYVALAEALDCPLLTADQRLSRAPGIGCEVELI